MMEGSEKKKIPVTLEPSPEGDKGKISEILTEGNHQKNKKKKEDKETEELKKKLEEKDKEAKENYDRLLRTAADFENYKKRSAREKEDWTKFANEDLIRAILPFIDNLERAVNHAQKIADTGVLVEGVRLTLQQLLQTLNKFGLSSFESVGKPFDPAMHEAMLVVETDKHEPNQVVEEFQKGYLLNDRLLRPATVSVSKPPEKEVRTSE
ncbi:MAG: nucleotide exchange factor GrpE [Thermodesulfobacteriota bacterium]|jgi:molecular chaperone GrpE